MILISSINIFIQSIIKMEEQINFEGLLFSEIESTKARLVKYK